MYHFKIIQFTKILLEGKKVHLIARACRAPKKYRLPEAAQSTSGAMIYQAM